MKELEGIVTGDQEIQSQQVTLPTPFPLALTSALLQRDTLQSRDVFTRTLLQCRVQNLHLYTITL